MPAKVKLPQGFLDKAMEIAEQRAIKALKNVGEACVAEAVANGNYTDQTGNLRSSIGYVISKDGQIIEEGGFWNLGGSAGQTAGREKARDKAAGIAGLALVLVAGMNYATYVADRGYNVLDSAEILAKQLITRLSR